MTDASAKKRIAIVLNDDFADWETAFLSSSARVFFGADVVHATPEGRPVLSMGHLQATGDAAIETIQMEQFDALVVCGSARWEDSQPLDISRPLSEALALEKVIGAICAGTLPVARDGLLDNHRHTSNAKQFLIDNAAAYRGADSFIDTPRAVADGTLITAPASAPCSFALAVLTALYPDQQPMIAQMSQMFSAEHRA